MRFLLAVQFLTIIPVKIKGRVTINDMAGAMSYFTLVGLLIGLIAAGIYAFTSLFLPAPVCDVIVIGAFVILTGNMHLDGVMDTADGLLSGNPKDKALEIMKDSRVGAHGVIAGALFLLIKFALLGSLDFSTKIAALIVMPVLGRWSQVYGAKIYSYARPGKGTGDFTRYVGFRELAIASLVAVPVVVLLSGVNSAAIIGTALVVTVLSGILVYKKIQGVTGDTLGAVTEVVEVAVLLCMQFLSFNIYFLKFLTFNS